MRAQRSKKSLIFIMFFNAFHVIALSSFRRSKTAPGAPKGKNRPIPFGKRIFLTYPPLRLSHRPRRSKRPPRSPQDGPRGPQDGSKTAQESSKMAPRRPQDGPRGAQEASKTAAGRLQEPSWFRDLSREPPGSLPDPPGRPLNASGSDFHVEMLASNKDQKTIQGSIQAVSKFNSLSTNPQGPINASRDLGGQWQRAKPLR